MSVPNVNKDEYAFFLFHAQLARNDYAQDDTAKKLSYICVIAELVQMGTFSCTFYGRHILENLIQ